MSLYIVDIHGELEGDYDIVKKYEEPTTKNDLGVDDEERELALMYLEQIKEDYIENVGYERHPLPEYYAIETAIKLLALPPVTPQEPKTGHWIKTGYIDKVMCSICNRKIWNFWEVNDFDYCPNCGAKMAESEAEDGKDD